MIFVLLSFSKCVPVFERARSVLWIAGMYGSQIPTVHGYVNNTLSMLVLFLFQWNSQTGLLWLQNTQSALGQCEKAGYAVSFVSCDRLGGLGTGAS